MLQIINNEIVKYSLPKTGTLSTGETVVNYHLLSPEILKQEGWLPLIDEPPEYDSETEYLTHDGYDIQENKVVKKYKVEPIPEPQPDPIEKLMERLDTLEQKATETETVIEGLQRSVGKDTGTGKG